MSSTALRLACAALALLVATAGCRKDEGPEKNPAADASDAAPTGLKATWEDGTATITWDAMTGAESYLLVYGTDPRALAVEQVDHLETARTSATQTGLGPGLVVHYAVAALLESGAVTPLSESARLEIPDRPPATPTGLTATASNNGVRLEWRPVPDATSYQLYWDLDGTPTNASNPIRNVEAPYLHGDVMPDTRIWYAVAAVNGAGSSQLSRAVSVTTPGDTAVAAPSQLDAVAGDGEVTLSWPSVAGATRYDVLYDDTAGVDPTLSTRVADVSAPHTVTGLANAQPWYFAVVAHQGAASSPLSPTATARPEVTTPANVTAAGAPTTVSVTWDAVPNADSYNVYWTNSPGVAIHLVTPVSVSAPPFDHQGLTDFVGHYYVVTAVKQGIESPPSAEVSAVPGFPPAPQLTLTPDDQEVRLDWTPVTGADRYRVWMSTDAGVIPATGDLREVLGPPYTFINVTNGTTYYFAVQAMFGGYVGPLTPEQSAVPNIPVPAMPAGLTATANGNNQIDLSWTSSDTPEGWVVYWDTSPGVTPSTGTPIDASATSLTHTGLQDGVTYHYVVVGRNKTVEGPVSTEASATATVTIPATPTNLGAYDEGGAARLTWTGDPGADSYDVYWSTTAGVTPANGTLVATVNGSTYLHAGATPDIPNYYVVVAANSAGSTGPSNEASVVPGAPVIVPEIATQGGHTVVLLDDGRLFGWGYNGSGQLADASYNDSSAPIPGDVSALGSEQLESVLTGWYHTVGLASDGTVWTWGWNGEGQLGGAAEQYRAEPYAVIDPTTSNPLADVVQIATGENFTLALTGVGEVWAWGVDADGQLGDGASGAFRGTPQRVVGVGGTGVLSGITGIGAGNSHAFAIGSNGELYAWGNNNFGQLGVGGNTDSATPIEATSLSGVVITRVTGGWDTSVAVSDGGDVYVFGDNRWGQLGLTTTDTCGTGDCAQTPVLLAAMSGLGVREVAAGIDQMHALTVSGALWSWGNNYDGQGGIGNRNDPILPTQVTGLSSVAIASVSAGEYQSVAVAKNGTVYRWGNGTADPYVINADGLIVDGVGSSGFGGGLTTASSDVRMWGDNGAGQLGTSDFIDRTSPTETTLTSVAIDQTAGGDFFNVFLARDGTVWAAGDNSDGQLGDNTTSLHEVPAPVLDETGSAALTGIQAVATGARHALALTDTNEVLAWGDAAQGQLGHGSTSDSLLPTPVLTSGGPLTNVVAIAAGLDHSVAVDGNGAVWVWGDNSAGQLGAASPDCGGSCAVYAVESDLSALPVGVAPDRVVACHENTLLIADDGSLWGLGANDYGQLGIGSSGPDEALVAFDLSGLPVGEMVVDAACGGQHTAVVVSDGSVWAAGTSSQGRLGMLNPANPETTLAPVWFLGEPGAGAVAVVAGYRHTVVLRDDGGLWSWGDGSDGALGNGSEDVSFVPRPVTNTGPAPF